MFLTKTPRPRKLPSRRISLPSAPRPALPCSPLQSSHTTTYRPHPNTFLRLAIRRSPQHRASLGRLRLSLPQSPNPHSPHPAFDRLRQRATPCASTALTLPDARRRDTQLRLPPTRRIASLAPTGAWLGIARTATIPRHRTAPFRLTLVQRDLQWSAARCALSRGR
jgi:hypothetical protein